MIRLSRKEIAILYARKGSWTDYFWIAKILQYSLITFKKQMTLIPLISDSRR